MGRRIRPDGPPLWSPGPSSAAWKTVPAGGNRTSVVAPPPSANPRTLLEQVEKALLDFLELRFEADLRAARFRFELAFTAVQLRIADQFGRWLECTRLRKIVIPELDIRRVRPEPHARSGVHLFQRDVHHARQKQRLHLRLPMQNLSGDRQRQLPG